MMHLRPAAAARAVALAATLVSGSCVDLKPAAPPPVRYLTVPPPSAAGGAAPDPADPRLRLAPIVSSAALGDRLVQRLSDYEVRFVDSVRFADPPDVLVRRALAAELFQGGGFTPSDVASRSLEVELVAFEEALRPRHEARVGLIVRVVGERGDAVTERIVEASAPIDGSDAALVAEALAAALVSAAAEVRDLAAR